MKTLLEHARNNGDDSLKKILDSFQNDTAYSEFMAALRFDEKTGNCSISQDELEGIVWKRSCPS